MGDCKRLAQRIANEETPEALQADVEPAKTDQRERIEAINALIESYIKQGRVDETQRVAVELRGRDLSPDEIDTLMETCIKKGWLHEIQEIAKLRGGNLSTGEIDALVNACVNKEWAYQAQKAAELGASKEVIDLLVKTCIKEGQFYDAQKAAKLRGGKLSKEEIDTLVDFYIKKGSIDSAQSGGFRFLKDPLFFAHGMFLENESRIVAMVMIMGLALMVYSIAERKLREALEKAGETIPDQKGKPTQK